jgi:hypothetical protein
LIVRILSLAGDYLSDSGGRGDGGGEPLPTPRGIIVTDSAKDLLAIGTMIFCILSLSKHEQGPGPGPGPGPSQREAESLEEIFPRKLLGLLGHPLSEEVADEICRRASESDFPSLVSDPYLSELTSVAMESSLHQSEKQSRKDCPSPPRPSSPLIESRKGSIGRPPLSVVVPRLSLREDLAIRVSTSTPDSVSSTSGDAYQPSWAHPSPDIASHPLTIEHDIEGYSSTLDSPWTKIHGTALTTDESRCLHTPVDSSVDRTKLAAIKRVGRKSASRRVRTANDLPSDTAQEEEWPNGPPPPLLPATANARLVSVGESDFGTRSPSDGPLRLIVTKEPPAASSPLASGSAVTSREDRPPRRRSITAPRPTAAEQSPFAPSFELDRVGEKHPLSGVAVMAADPPPRERVLSNEMPGMPSSPPRPTHGHRHRER